MDIKGCNRQQSRELCPLAVLGSVELDLHNLITPTKMSHKCSIDMLSREGEIPHQKWDATKSLFHQKAVRGWWPCVVEKDGKKELGVSTVHVA